MKKPVGIILNGANGKMGRLLKDLIDKDERYRIVSIHDAGSELSDSSKGDVVVDFSSPKGFQKALETCLKFKTGFFSGTTGLDQSHKDAIGSASKSIPVFYSPNMSIGVNLLVKIISENSRILKNYDAEIVEIHHKAKKDSPSGTALLLAETAGVDISKIHAIREADIPGDHWIYFARRGELLEFHHRAVSREVFAGGALEAIFWFSGQTTGFYSMKDFLSTSL
ncbi:4-hydroxy-tetrahydrodipicolinate reductase [candidate division WOR-3 bacterium]|nr:4-hydroxy-tetrahydrodipicolinate reductase [candidate division WOR-3 bacterium]